MLYPLSLALQCVVLYFGVEECNKPGFPRNKTKFLSCTPDLWQALTCGVVVLCVLGAYDVCLSAEVSASVPPAQAPLTVVGCCV